MQRLIIDRLEVARALYQAAQRHPGAEPNRWAKIAEELNEQFKLEKKPTTWRAMWSKLRVRYGLIKSPYYDYVSRRPLEELIGDDATPQQKGQGEAKHEILNNLPPEDVRGGKESTRGLDRVRELLAQQMTLKDLAKKLDAPEGVAAAYIEALRHAGYQVVEAGGFYWHEKKPLLRRNEVEKKWNGERIIRFGVVSDTHCGNHYQQQTHLETFYDRCAEKEIDTVYHGGDISDGFYPNRPEQIFELHSIGLEAQAKYLVQNYPKRTGIKTLFIEGNHDATHMKNGGGSIGRRLEIERPDMEYLGYGKVKVWLTPKCDMDIVHPNGGKSYALSYKLQKAIDALQGGTKPRILLMGHFHAYCNIWYRNVHAFMLPGFQAQNTWATLGFLQFQVGGIIYEVSVNDNGEITGIQPTLYPFYVMKDKDY